MSIELMTRVWKDGPDDQTETLVLLKLADHANDDGSSCYPSVASIAENCRMTRRGAVKVIRRLEEGGWISRHVRGGGQTNLYEIHTDRFDEEPKTPERRSSPNDVHPRTTFRVPPNDVQGDPESRSGGPRTTFTQTINEPSIQPSEEPIIRVESADADRPPWLQRLMDEICWEGEPLPDDHPARWEYHPGDWRWEAGLYVLNQLQAHDMLNTHYHRRLRDGCREGQIASEWGDTFRLLVEQDGWQREEIGVAMRWLFETDNWWRRNRTIQSAAALRRTDETGTTKFDKIVQSALADYEHQRREHPTPEDLHESWDESIAEVEQELGDELPDPSGSAVAAQ